MAAEGGCIDFMFLGPLLTRPLDPLLVPTYDFAKFPINCMKLKEFGRATELSAGHNHAARLFTKAGPIQLVDLCSVMLIKEAEHYCSHQVNYNIYFAPTTRIKVLSPQLTFHYSSRPQCKQYTFIDTNLNWKCNWNPLLSIYLPFPLPY